MKFRHILATGLGALCFMGAHGQLNKVSLNSDSDNIEWRLRPQAEVVGEEMLRSSYDASSWTKAVVPGANLTSYVEAGEEVDPNWGDNCYTIDKAKYDRNFWYRGEFDAPQVREGEILWLNFEGVNRNGDIWFNGNFLGRLDGFMDRGKFDITRYVNEEGKNIVAVLVHWVGVPVTNFRAPTYQSSSAWDWMPYVPGLLSGITDDVYLSTSREVELIDPWVRTKVPSKDRGEIGVELELKNNSFETREVTLRGTVQPGGMKVEQTFEVQGMTTRPFVVDEKLVVENPKLWWPNGYGEPNLYTMNFTIEVDGEVSDAKTVTFGIKEYDYEFVNDNLIIKVNGEPIFCKGGSWGMSEYMLRARGEEYDLKAKLHTEMNFNMIRNWIGSTTDDEFYQACDKYGIMVWDDFWLNSNKNLPYDLVAFHNNAIQKVKRLRNHASVAVWCGDNEGYPVEPLNSWLKAAVEFYDGGDRRYHANSNSDGVSGSSPWTNEHPAWYFTDYPRGYGPNATQDWGFRSEIGTAAFTTFESFKKFMPEENWWPRDEMWNKHFFGPLAGNSSPDKYYETVEKNYGTATGIEDFCRKSQLVNIEVNKAIYEGWNHNLWDRSTGVLLWMSQSAYPSFVWQTYDYYYDLTGAYWGAKKACEPVHIQWSYADNTVKVINTTLETKNNLTAKATIYNMDGRAVKKYGMSAQVDSKANAATDAFTLVFPSKSLAYKKKATASGERTIRESAQSPFDGNPGSKWVSPEREDAWISVDLGEAQEIGRVAIQWYGVDYARAYKILVSDDAQSWTEVYSAEDRKGGREDITFEPVTARYVKMQGVKRNIGVIYMIDTFEVYPPKMPKLDITDVHFIRLELTDEDGNPVSDNFYWRSTEVGDYTALNNMPKASASVATHSIVTDGDRKTIRARIKNRNGVAFAVHVQAYRSADGERIMPAIMNDNYFTLMPGEYKDVEIEFCASLLPDNKYKLVVTPYNN